MLQHTRRTEAHWPLRHRGRGARTSGTGSGVTLGSTGLQQFAEYLEPSRLRWASEKLGLCHPATLYLHGRVYKKPLGVWIGSASYQKTAQPDANHFVIGLRAACQRGSSEWSVCEMRGAFGKYRQPIEEAIRATGIRLLDDATAATQGAQQREPSSFEDLLTITPPWLVTQATSLERSVLTYRMRVRETNALRNFRFVADTSVPPTHELELSFAPITTEPITADTRWELRNIRGSGGNATYRFLQAHAAALPYQLLPAPCYGLAEVHTLADITTLIGAESMEWLRTAHTDSLCGYFRITDAGDTASNTTVVGFRTSRLQPSEVSCVSRHSLFILRGDDGHVSATFPSGYASRQRVQNAFAAAGVRVVE